MNTRILVVAYDAMVRATLARLFAPEGWAVELAEGAIRAREVLAEGPIALAFLAPDRLGAATADLARELREAAGALIVIVEQPRNGQALGEWTFGGDTLLANPLDEREVLARARAMLRQLADAEEPAATIPQILYFDELTLDVAGHSVLNAQGQAVPVTHAEFELLLVFARHPGQVLSRDRLLDLAAGRRADAFDRRIDVMISRLRRKTEPDPKTPSIILTIPGVGYKFAARLRPAPVVGEPVVDAPQRAIVADRPPPRPADRVGRPFARAVLIATVLAIVAGMLLLSHSNPEHPTVMVMPAEGHWINGTWAAILTQEPISDPNFCDKADTRCRTFVMSSVGGDGDFRGAWGYQGELPAPAYVTVSGQSVRVISSTDTLFEAQLGADGVLSGTFTGPPQTMVTSTTSGVPITFRKIKPSTEAEPDHDHWANGTWVGLLAREPVSDPKFCARPDIRCRTLVLSNVQADGKFVGAWAFQGEKSARLADVTVSGQSVRIDFRNRNYIEVRRDAAGMLSGMFVMPLQYPLSTSQDLTSATGMVTLRKLKQ
jgi:DNA-binding response OmpR family regulator